jgi:hypothetical protein
MSKPDQYYHPCEFDKMHRARDRECDSKRLYRRALHIAAGGHLELVMQWLKQAEDEKYGDAKGGAK